MANAPPPAAPSAAAKIAQRIGLELTRELGTPVDAQRMLAQPLYARDVLLVCDAMRGSELAALAEDFRHAQAESAAPAAREPAPAPSASDPAPDKPPSSRWARGLFRTRRAPRTPR